MKISNSDSAAHSPLPRQRPSLLHNLSQIKARAKAAFRGVFCSSTTPLPRSVIASSFTINLLGLALPLVMLQVYDRILINQSLATLGYLMLGLAAAIIIEAVLKIARAYLMSWSATRQSYAKDLDAISRIVHAPHSLFARSPANIWMERLESLNRSNTFSTGQSRLILLDLPFVAIYLGVIFLVAGSLGFVLIAMIGLFAISITLRAKALRTVLDERTLHGGRRDDFIGETLEGIEAVKSMVMEPLIMRRFERLQQASAEISHRNMLLSNELQIYSSLLGNIVLVSVVSVGALMVIEGALSIGALACCTLLTSRVIQPVMRGIQVSMELESAQQAEKTASALFELPQAAPSDTQQDTRCRGEISFDKVSFTHEGNEQPTIRDTSLEISSGEFIGIRGEDASGKSSLLKLVSGELAPTKGSCRIDGKNIEDPDQKPMLSRVGYISCDSTIFQGTIMDNITMFRRGPIIENARFAASLIGLEDDIHRLPLGYDTPIGQGITEVLPNGMVQRIVIARALAFRPAILLFDDANSSLDMRSDSALRNGLNRLKGKMTLLLVSNRPSLLAIADRRFELVKGSLVELDAPTRPARDVARQAAGRA